MRLLFDTHVLLWALAEPERLDPRTRGLIEDPANEAMFSAVNIWEIAIKTSLGRVDFTPRPEEIAQEARRVGFIELPMYADAASLVRDLPWHHRDPFDRLLVAQAMAGPMRLYTADSKLARYSELVTVLR